MHSRIAIADAEDAVCAVLNDYSDKLRAEGLPGLPAFTLSQKAGERMRRIAEDQAKNEVSQ